MLSVCAPMCPSLYAEFAEPDGDTPLYIISFGMTSSTKGTQLHCEF